MVFVPVLAVIDRLRTAPRLALVMVLLVVPGLAASTYQASYAAAMTRVTVHSREGLQVVGPLLEQMALAAAGRPVDAGVADDVERTYPDLAEQAGALRAAAYDPAAELRFVGLGVGLVDDIAARAELDRPVRGTDDHVAHSLVVAVPQVVLALASMSSPAARYQDDVGRGVQLGRLSLAASLVYRDDVGPADAGAPHHPIEELAPLSAVAQQALALAGNGTSTTPTGGRSGTAMGATPTPTAVALALADALPGATAVLDGDLTDRLQFLQQRLLAVTAVLAAGTLLAVWVGLALVWRTRTDVDALVDAVTALARAEDTPVPVPLRRDEFGDIGRVVVTTRERMARSARQLAHESEERARLLAATQARENLLKHLLLAQRAVSAGRPLQQVLDMVTRSAADLLGDVVVGLVLVDRTGDAGARAPWVASAFGHVDGRFDSCLLAAGSAAVSGSGHATVDLGGEGTRPAGAAPSVAVGVPVHLGGTVAGALVAVMALRPDREVADETDLLNALAQQVTLALSEARNAEEVLQAHHDWLTGLPTRALFLDTLTRELTSPEADAAGPALLFIDLDRFKGVNDTLGHQAGDELLAAAAARLRGCLRGGDSPARLGGDEFAVLLPGASLASACAVAQRIITAIREPFVIAGTTVAVDSSIGVAMPATASGTTPAGEPAECAAALLSCADIAMYQAKKRGGGHLVVFEDRMREEAVQRLRVVSDVRRALAGEEFRMVFQPITRLASGGLHGLAALPRWEHPQRGLIPPAQFMPVAAEIGLTGELGRWVMREALTRFAPWLRVRPELGLRITLSGSQLRDPLLGAEIAGQLRSAGVRPDAVTMELPEAVLAADLVGTPVHLNRLAMVGVRLAVDGFGTGYSSPGYLRGLPLDGITIDGRFVAGLGEDPENLAVVTSALDLAASLRLQAVAAGVTHAGQVALLRQLGCEFGRGPLLGTPVPAQDVEALVSAAAPVDA